MAERLSEGPPIYQDGWWKDDQGITWTCRDLKIWWKEVVGDEEHPVRFVAYDRPPPGENYKVKFAFGSYEEDEDGAVLEYDIILEDEEKMEVCTGFHDWLTMIQEDHNVDQVYIQLERVSDEEAR